MKIILFLFFLLSIINADYLAKDIKFEGLTQISEKIASERIIIQKNDRYNDDDINQIIKMFYKYNYFTDISVYNQNNILTFKFTEKPFIVNLEMKGYKNRDDEVKELYKSIQIKKGTMYTPEKIARSKKLLLKELENEGYINSVVDIEVITINPQSKSVIFNVNKGEEILITKVNYINQEKLDIDLFEDNTANKELEVFSWWFGQNDGVLHYSQIEYDHLRIKDGYLEYGYLDAKVTPAFSKIDYNNNSAEIDFKIHEGNQYKINNIIIYNDEKIVKTKILEEGLKSKKTKIFNIKKLRKDVQFIKTEIGNKGYAFAKVAYDVKKDKDKHTTDLFFNVNAGEKVYINDVIISGNTRTLDRVVRRSVYLAPEDLYNATDFSDSKKALSRTGYFSNVSISTKKVSNNRIDLLVHVTETATGNLTLGGGYGSYDGWTVNAGINDKNIFGSGLNLGLALSHSNKNDSATISLKNPSVNDSIYNSNFSIYKTFETIDNDTTGDETTETVGGSFGLGRGLGRHTRVGATYALEEKTVKNSLTTVEDTRYVESSITPYISFDNTDDYYTARTGIQTGFAYKYVGIGGDGEYTQSSAYFKYFYGLEDLIDYDLIFRFKSNARVMNDRGFIPAGTSYYLGGVRSVRGYSSYAFQPIDDDTPYKKYFVNTVELSFPLMPKANFRWSLFYDHGNIGYNDFDELTKSGYGVSLNWYSPVGPIQFIFPKAINPDADDDTSNFEFSLGTKF